MTTNENILPTDAELVSLFLPHTPCAPFFLGKENGLCVVPHLSRSGSLSLPNTLTLSFSPLPPLSNGHTVLAEHDEGHVLGVLLQSSSVQLPRMERMWHVFHSHMSLLRWTEVRAAPAQYTAGRGPQPQLEHYLSKNGATLFVTNICAIQCNTVQLLNIT